MLQKNLWKRIIILLLIGAALMLPMGMIVELIWVRKVSQNNVLQEIASSSTGAQSVNGPVLIVPYTRRVEVMRTSVDNHGKTIEKRDFDTFSEIGRAHV